jgi:hypothetical protein
MPTDSSNGLGRYYLSFDDYHFDLINPFDHFLTQIPLTSTQMRLICFCNPQSIIWP